MKLKSIVLTTFLSLAMFFTAQVNAQSSCKTDKDGKKIACETSAKKSDATSGCAPSACRGSKTKFGEAKVISNLRLNLIALKAEIEKSKKPSFDSRTYDIHGIVGKTDDESIQIIAKEVKIIEKVFSSKLNHKVLAFSLPENKAKQVSYLDHRIKDLKNTLSSK